MSKNSLVVNISCQIKNKQITKIYFKVDIHIYIPKTFLKIISKVEKSQKKSAWI
jgi:hypothetical protein